jgi:hypothetical protein
MEFDHRIEDLRNGHDWWHSLSKDDQMAWLARVHSVRPKDAWDAFKRSLMIVGSDRF